MLTDGWVCESTATSMLTDGWLCSAIDNIFSIDDILWGCIRPAALVSANLLTEAMYATLQETRAESVLRTAWVDGMINISGVLGALRRNAVAGNAVADAHSASVSPVESLDGITQPSSQTAVTERILTTGDVVETEVSAAIPTILSKAPNGPLCDD